jgi:hypothetical protein
MSKVYKLKAGSTLTVSVSEGTASVKQVEDATVGAIVTLSRTFGSYPVDRTFVVSDNATVTISEVVTESAALFLSGTGAPENAVKATLAVNPAGNDNALTFTAKMYGAEGNLISVLYVDPSANNAALSVSVFRRQITVSLATGAGGAITSTSAQVLAAINASVAAAKLVSVAILSDTGTSGAGIVTAMAEALLTGGLGTGIDRALPACQYADITNAFIYRNSGAQAAPIWTKLADA